MTKLLTPVLLFDAVTCAGLGAVLIAAADPLAGVLGLPRALLLGAALILLAFAGFLMWAARSAARGWPARAAGLANLGWVAGSLALLPLFSPTPIGTALILAQAVAVAIVAVAQLHLSAARPQLA